MNLGQNVFVFLTISRPSSNMGHVGLKTRLPGQIFRFIPSRCRLLYIKRWKKGTRKNLLSQVSVPGPSGPSCYRFQLKKQTKLHFVINCSIPTYHCGGLFKNIIISELERATRVRCVKCVVSYMMGGVRPFAVSRWRYAVCKTILLFRMQT